MSPSSRDIPENHMRLGRHVEHDPRSWAYRLDDAVRGVDIINVAWTNYSNVLDQGDLGACVGFATTACVGTTPNWQALNGGQSADVQLNSTGVKIYCKATELDQYRGTYPPDDTGSTGIAGAKAAQSFGYIRGYTHAFSFEAMTKALMLGPLIVGTNWYDSMFTARTDGLVAITPSARVAGGHEYLVYGYRDGNFWCQNSWGKKWGNAGRFYMNSATMNRLLGEQGDATQFVRADEPAPAPVPPTPTPSPTPSADDVQLWTAMQVWAKKKGLTT